MKSVTKKKAARKAKRASRVPLTRAGETWSEAKFWSFIRSNIRKMSMKWPPIRQVKMAARRPYTGENKRQKFEYLCSMCKEWYSDKETAVDHIVPCGSLRSFLDAAIFLERLLCEAIGLRVLCEKCHNKVTHQKGETE